MAIEPSIATALRAGHIAVVVTFRDGNHVATTMLTDHDSRAMVTITVVIVADLHVHLSVGRRRHEQRRRDGE
jgi:hypothetical protein